MYRNFKHFLASFIKIVDLKKQKTKKKQTTDNFGDDYVRLRLQTLLCSLCQCSCWHLTLQYDVFQQQWYMASSSQYWHCKVQKHSSTACKDDTLSWNLIYISKHLYLDFFYNLTDRVKRALVQHFFFYIIYPGNTEITTFTCMNNVF